MIHARQQIRAQAVAVIGTIPELRGRVIAGHTYSLQEKDLPIVCVYARNEKSELDGLALDDPLSRTLQLAIDIYEQGQEQADTNIDAIAALIESAMAASAYFSGDVVFAVPISFELDVSANVSRATGHGKMVFSVSYMTPLQDPATICT